MKNGGNGSTRKRVIALLKAQPGMLAKELSEALERSLSATQTSLRLAACKGLIHQRETYSPLGSYCRWYAGPAPTLEPASPVLQALCPDDALTVKEIMDHLGWRFHRVYSHLVRARKANLARIAAWRRDPGSGNPQAIWALGAGFDASRPRRLTSAQRSRRYYQNHKAVCQARGRACRGTASPRLWIPTFESQK